MSNQVQPELDANLLGRLADIEAIAAYFASQPDVVIAYLFGSVVHGRVDKLSDLDVAVLLDTHLEALESVERQLVFMAD